MAVCGGSAPWIALRSACQESREISEKCPPYFASARAGPAAIRASRIEPTASDRLITYLMKKNFLLLTYCVVRWLATLDASATSSESPKAFQSSLNVRGPDCIRAHQTASRPCTGCTVSHAQQRASLALRATYACPTPTPGSRLSDRRAPPRVCCARRCATCRARRCASVSTLAR